MEQARGNLRVLHGPHWSLPIWAVTMDNVARVRPAGNLTRLMLEALLARFAELGTFNGQDWFLTAERLRQHADCVKDSTPDDLISWTWPVGRAALREQPKGMEGFFEDFARAGHAATAEEAQLRYGAWCQHMFDWLVNKKKPVNLGFAVLEPLPCRVNWREILAHKLACSCQGAAKPWRERMERVKTFMISGDLLMAHLQERRLYWTITLRHTKEWWKGVTVAEKARLKRNPRRYFLNTLHILKEKLPVMYEAFVHYLSEARRPCCKFHKRALRSHKSAYWQPKLASVEKYLKFLHSGVAFDPRVGSNIAPLHVGRKVTGVRKVRSVQPEDESVRDAGADVVQPCDTANGTTGVPLLHEGEGNGAGS